MLIDWLIQASWKLNTQLCRWSAFCLISFCFLSFLRWRCSVSSWPRRWMSSLLSHTTTLFSTDLNSTSRGVEKHKYQGIIPHSTPLARSLLRSPDHFPPPSCRRRCRWRWIRCLSPQFSNWSPDPPPECELLECVSQSEAKPPCDNAALSCVSPEADAAPSWDVTLPAVCLPTRLTASVRALKNQKRDQGGVQRRSDRRGQHLPPSPSPSHM